MQTLEECRDQFVDDMRRRTDPSDFRRFSEIIDDFVSWSVDRSDILHHTVKEKRQKVLEFARTSDGSIIWTAWPQDKGETKIAFLHQDRNIPEPLYSEVLAELRTMTRSTINDGGVLHLRFRALRAPASRQRVKTMIERLVRDYPQQQRAGVP